MTAENSPTFRGTTHSHGKIDLTALFCDFRDTGLGTELLLAPWVEVGKR